ncbi:hypothetical protein MYX82_10950 [Acidobacteria bacterium AH-259-D05]|nr:hypothetical protein [Acidobacteria bacterium AH-259-D05]
MSKNCGVTRQHCGLFLGAIVLLIVFTGLGLAPTENTAVNVRVEFSQQLRVGHSIDQVAVTREGKILVLGPNGKAMQAQISIFILQDDGSMRRLANREFPGGSVRRMAVSPDGQEVALGYGAFFPEHNEYKVEVFKLEDLEFSDEVKPRVLGAHRDGVDWVAYSASGDYLASASYGRNDRTVRIWNARKAVPAFKPIDMGYFSDKYNLGRFAFYKDSILLGERRFIDATNHQVLPNFEPNEQLVSASDIALSEKRNVLAIAGVHAYPSPDVGMLSVLDVSNVWEVKPLRIFQISPASQLTSVALTEDGSLIAVGTDSGQVLIYSPDAEDALDSKETPDKSSVESLAFLPDGGFLVSGHGSGNIASWRIIRH